MYIYKTHIMKIHQTILQIYVSFSVFSFFSYQFLETTKKFIIAIINTRTGKFENQRVYFIRQHEFVKSWSKFKVATINFISSL